MPKLATKDEVEDKLKEHRTYVNKNDQTRRHQIEGLETLVKNAFSGGTPEQPKPEAKTQPEVESQVDPGQVADEAVTMFRRLQAEELQKRSFEAQQQFIKETGKITDKQLTEIKAVINESIISGTDWKPEINEMITKIKASKAKPDNEEVEDQGMVQNEVPDLPIIGNARTTPVTNEMQELVKKRFSAINLQDRYQRRDAVLETTTAALRPHIDEAIKMATKNRL